MKLYVVFEDTFMDNAKDDKEYYELEKYTDELKKKTLIDNNILFDNHCGIFIFKEEYAKELMKKFDCSFDDLYCFNCSINQDDWFDLCGFSFKKQDCIELLGDKMLENDKEVIEEIEKCFNNNIDNFDNHMIDFMFKYVVRVKIEELKQYENQELEPEWR